MNYDYLICGLRVRFVIPWAVKTTAESAPFLTSPECSGQPDLTVRICVADAIDAPEEGGVWNVNSYYLSGPEGQRVWHCALRGQPPYCCVAWSADASDTVVCRCLRGQEHRIAYTRNLLGLLGLERFLLRSDALVLHSSLVDWEGRGILFCAPSGTGKSTQADLWEQHMGSRTLNGDRAGLRCEEGLWRAWGLPLAGTSGIYRNESVPICAVVLLRQGEQNTLSPVRPIEAFKAMLPECSAQRWDPGFMDRLAGVLSALVGAIPVYRLECRPDRDAVELLRHAILKEG